MMINYVVVVKKSLAKTWKAHAGNGREDKVDMGKSRLLM
jgi:hypothetical protein